LSSEKEIDGFQMLEMNDTTSPALGNRFQLTSKLCLIVDDEAPIRLYVRDLLKGEGYETLEASTVKDARWLLQNQGHDVDLIISDITMPGGDGLVFVAEIREVYPTVPIIVMSGHAEAERTNYPLGIFEFLQKPFRPGRLLGAIQKATRMIELRRESSSVE
jgi:two-component system nitrogen regulation response regulator NtrX